MGTFLTKCEHYAHCAHSRSPLQSIPHLFSRPVRPVAASPAWSQGVKIGKPPGSFRPLLLPALSREPPRRLECRPKLHLLARGPFAPPRWFWPAPASGRQEPRREALVRV
jgi:hypothetical protein